MKFSLRAAAELRLNESNHHFCRTNSQLHVHVCAATRVPVAGAPESRQRQPSPVCRVGTFALRCSTYSYIPIFSFFRDPEIKMFLAKVFLFGRGREIDSRD